MNNVKVQSHNDGVRVSLSGTDRLWALRKEVFLPAEAIESIEVRPRKELSWWKAWLRAPGTSLPGVIRAGIYYGSGAKEFWSVRDQAELLVIKADKPSQARHKTCRRRLRCRQAHLPTLRKF